MNRIILFLFCLFSSFLYAQPGTNDSLFNVLDPGFSNGLGPNDQLRAVALQADGKVLVGGFFTKFNEKNINRIARLKEGVLDTSFKVGTGFSDYVQCIALQADGKIIVGGNFTSYGGTNRNRIVRLNTDGSLDLSFNIGAGFNGLVRKLIVLPDGKILAFGNFTSYRGIPRNFIVRINTNGTVDTDFNSGANGTIYDAFVQPDSKIVIGGGFTLYDGIIKERIARINSDGSLDSNFAIGFAFNTTVYALKPYRKGKILVGGEFINFQGVSRNKIALIDSLGNLDLAFDPSLGFSSGVYSLLVQTDGKIIASGSFVSYRGISCGKVARLDSLARLDTTYLSGSGITGGTTTTVYESVMDSLGRIIFVGSFANYSNKSRNHLVRTYPDGKPDYALNEPTGFNAIPRNFLVQPDGKILCVGDFKLVHGKEFASIVRLNMDGTPDTSFSIGTGFNDELSGYYAKVLALQKDGKILVGGNFINFNGKQVASIIRLFPNGILDTSFISNNYNEIINDIEILDDGRILIAGDFGSYQGKMQKKIARLLPNGILDTTFLVNPGFDNAVKDILIQPDGKILAAGNFNEYNNQYLNTRIIRLNENGLIDSSFNFNNTIVGGINSIGLQPDGKVVMAGIFTSVNGVSRNRIARLNSDGTFDNSFYPGSSSFNGIVNKILVQADGSILVIGAFTQFNTSPQSRIARLLPDGALDNTINFGTGFLTSPESISLQADGKIIVGGNFTSYNSIGRNRVVRLNNNCIKNYRFLNQTACSSFDFGGQTYSNSGTYQKTYTNVGGCDSIVTLNLTIYTDTFSMLEITACDSFVIGGTTLYGSGLFNVKLKRTTGCDSMVFLNLNIKNSSSLTLTETACKSYSLNGVKYEKSGTYFQKINNSVACDSIIKLELTLNQIETGVSIVNSTTLKSNATNASYQWIDCDNQSNPILPGENDNSFTATKNGKYAVIVTQNNCIDTSDCYSITSVGIHNFIEELNIQIFPNPTKNELNLVGSKQLIGSSISIRSISGKVLFEPILVISETTRLNLADLAAGFYFIEIAKHEKVVRVKLIKE